MRYTTQEGSDGTVLAGMLPAGGAVTITIIDMKNDLPLDLNTVMCTESTNIPGVYLFDIANITNSVNTFTNCLYSMTDGTKTFYGKFVINGYVEFEDIGDILTKLTNLNDFDPDVDIVKLSDAEIHAALDSYSNKSDWIADLTGIVTSLDAITALNNEEKTLLNDIKNLSNAIKTSADSNQDTIIANMITDKGEVLQSIIDNKDALLTEITTNNSSIFGLLRKHRGRGYA